MNWSALSTMEQLVLVALSNDGDDLAHLAEHADQLHRDIASLLLVVDHALGLVAIDDPLREDLEEIHAAATLAASKLAQYSDRSSKPHLFLVP